MEDNEQSKNSVFIGRKDTMTYVFSVQTQANSYDNIFIKARGNAISKAVDVAQRVVNNNRFLKGWHIKNTTLGTEERPRELREGDDPEQEGKLQRVSTIDIELSKQ